MKSSSLHILVLGGSGFLGTHQVHTALARGHKVTLFNRGKGDIPDGVELLVGDRDAGDLTSLEGRTWDAVIDNCRDNPSWIADSTRALKNSVQHYLYVSSISAYADTSVIGTNEEAALLTLPPEPEAARDPKNFGGAKAECERLVREAFDGRFTIARPGLLVGPGDPTDRFTYWVLRFPRGGEVLCPGTPADFTQVLDARDAAEWMINALENRHLGIYNLTGLIPEVKVGALLETINQTVGEGARLNWVPAEFLEKQGVSAWWDMPCWVLPENSGFMAIDNSKAIAAGLATRPLTETVSDTLAWALTREPSTGLKAGLTSQREAKVLTEWRKSKG